jgi:hypothetical protein
VSEDVTPAIVAALDRRLDAIGRCAHKIDLEIKVLCAQPPVPALADGGLMPAEIAASVLEQREKFVINVYDDCGQAVGEYLDDGRLEEIIKKSVAEILSNQRS